MLNTTILNCLNINSTYFARNQNLNPQLQGNKFSPGLEFFIGSDIFYAVWGANAPPSSASEALKLNNQTWLRKSSKKLDQLTDRNVFYLVMRTKYFQRTGKFLPLANFVY